MCEIASCTPQPYDQNALISAVAAANPNTIVVLDTGGPVLMPWVNSVKGLFEAWYPGQEDGDAIAALLFGDVDPSGRLTETFPASQSDIPEQSAAQWPGVTQAGDSVGPHSQYSEGLLVGYRWYDAKGIRPLFPFGFGLDYTTFGYSGMTLRATQRRRQRRPGLDPGHQHRQRGPAPTFRRCTSRIRRRPENRRASSRASPT